MCISYRAFGAPKCAPLSARASRRTVLPLPELPRPLSTNATTAVLRALDTMKSRGVKGKDFKEGVRDNLRATFGHPLKVRYGVFRVRV